MSENLSGNRPSPERPSEQSAPRLVYCEGPWAFFTTRPDWQKQWGDDWNDTPYEHNAGEPYTWRDYMGERGVPPYEIVKVAWDGADLQLPCDGHLNSPYSVEYINGAAQVPWLRSSEWAKHVIGIMAGVTLREFIALVNQADGTVYMPLEGQSRPAQNDPQASSNCRSTSSDSSVTRSEVSTNLNASDPSRTTS